MGRRTPRALVIGAFMALVASCSPGSSGVGAASRPCAGAFPGCGSAVSSAVDITKGHWASIPSGPLAPRSGQATAWTGSEMIVWGGLGAPAPAPGATVYAPPAFSDGAAYDPRTRSWAMLPPSPLAPRSDAAVVWDGQAVIIFGGHGEGSPTEPYFADGASYDPSRHLWRMLPRGPLSGRFGATALWTGSQAVIIGGIGSNGYGLTDGATYDPTTRHWRLLPKLPRTTSPYGSSGGATASIRPEGIIATWTGTEVLGWAIYEQRVSGRGAGLLTIAAAEQNLSWTPGSNHWVVHHKPPAGQPLVGAAPYWTGTRVLFFGGGPCIPSAPCAPSIPTHIPVSSYDPKTGRWLILGGRAVLKGAGSFVWTGKAVIAVNGGSELGTPIAATLAVFDVRRDQWLSVPTYPYGALYSASAIWTGSSLLVWGSGGFGSPDYGALLF